MKDNLRILEECGVKKQFPIWVEEMSELTKALCKWIRKYDELEGDMTASMRDDIIEEYVDVIICLEQIKHCTNMTEEEIKVMYDYKVRRQVGRVFGEENE